MPKLSKVAMWEKILSDSEQEQLRHLVGQAKHVVTVCHQNADGDAIGSSAAVALLMQRLGKTVTCIAPNNFPDFLRWIPTAGNILLADRQHTKVDAALAKADLVIMLDFNTPKRMGDLLAQKVLESKAPRVMIDHHIDPDTPCNLIISHPYMCSTCELLLRTMQDMGWTDGLTTEEATALYTGLMTDTGCFTYASNRPEIFEAVSLLLRAGIDKDRIYRNIFFTYTEGRFRLLGYLLYAKMEVIKDLHTSLITMTNEERKLFQVKNGATEGFVNQPLQMLGMKLSIFLREDTEQKGVIRVSTRSVDDFPCNELCAEFFNGGGHKNASGGTLQMSMEEAVETVKKALKAYESKLKDNDKKETEK